MCQISNFGVFSRLFFFYFREFLIREDPSKIKTSLINSVLQYPTEATPEYRWSNAQCVGLVKNKRKVFAKSRVLHISSKEEGSK